MARLISKELIWRIDSKLFLVLIPPDRLEHRRSKEEELGLVNHEEEYDLDPV